MSFPEPVEFHGLSIDARSLSEFSLWRGPFPRDWHVVSYMQRKAVSRRPLNVLRPELMGERLARWLETRATGRFAIDIAVGNGFAFPVTVAFERLSDAVMFRFDPGANEWMSRAQG